MTAVDFSGSTTIEERIGAFGDQNVIGVAGRVAFRDVFTDVTLSSGWNADWRTYAPQDANGDLVALVGNGTAFAGIVRERYADSPYGVASILDASGSPASSSPFAWRQLFQGGRLDATTGLYVFGFRDYDPAAGVWMQRDPIGLAGRDANLYRFTGNNPVNFIDPSGLFGIGDVVSGTLNLGYNLVAGDAGAVYEIGAMPIDVVGRALSSRPWTPLSSFGEASQQALRDGVSPLQITGDFANENTLAITTLGVYPVVKAAKKSYDTGDPKEVERAAGALLLGVAGARYLGRVNVGPKPRPGTKASSSPGGVGDPCPPIKPGQVASPYPRGRIIGGNKQGVRPTDLEVERRQPGAFDLTQENLNLMEQGRPPIGNDRLRVELHHQNQKPRGPFEEVTSTYHDTFSHPIRPSPIDRSVFAGERSRYWASRSRELLGQ